MRSASRSFLHAGPSLAVRAGLWIRRREDLLRGSGLALWCESVCDRAV